MPEAFVVTPATRPAPLNVVREQITVLAPGSRTGGYEIFRQAGPVGSGPPPHYHPWDESFYVVSGNIAFGVGDKDMIAEPGTLVHLPAGTMHWFRFGQGGGEMISMTSREAASHFFTDVHRAISPERSRSGMRHDFGAQPIFDSHQHRSSIVLDLVGDDRCRPVHGRREVNLGTGLQFPAPSQRNGNKNAASR